MSFIIKFNNCICFILHFFFSLNDNLLFYSKWEEKFIERRYFIKILNFVVFQLLILLVSGLGDNW